MVHWILETMFIGQKCSFFFLSVCFCEKPLQSISLPSCMTAMAFNMIRATHTRTAYCPYFVLIVFKIPIWNLYFALGQTTHSIKESLQQSYLYLCQHLLTVVVRNIVADDKGDPGVLAPWFQPHPHAWLRRQQHRRHQRQQDLCPHHCHSSSHGGSV